MDCRDAIEQLSADVDGELPVADAELLRRHLESCEACAGKRVLLAGTRWAYRSVAPEPVSADFAEAVARRLRPKLGMGWWLSAAAALAAVLPLVWLMEPEIARRPVRPIAAPSAAVRNHQPGWSEGSTNLALDCGLPKAVTCKVETPCADGDCLLAKPSVSLAGFSTRGTRVGRR